MPAKFVVEKQSDGNFHFTLLGRNGRLIITSDAYNSKASCMNGIKAVKSAAADADIEDRTTKAQQAKTREATTVAAQAAKETIERTAAKRRQAAKKT